MRGMIGSAGVIGLTVLGLVSAPAEAQRRPEGAVGSAKGKQAAPAKGSAARSTPAPAAKRQLGPMSSTTGLMLGIGVGAAGVNYDDDQEEEAGVSKGWQNGGGLALNIGYGITPNVLVYLQGHSTRVDAKELLSAFGVEDVEGNYALTHGDLGVRWHFLPGKALVPYADVAVSSRRVSTEIEGQDGEGNPIEGELKMTGGVGFAVGGGMQYFFKPNLALDTQLKLNFGGAFDKAEFDGDEIQGFEDTSARSARLFVGVAWYPMANRMSGRR